VWEPVPPPGSHPLNAYLSVIGPRTEELDARAREEAQKVAGRGAELATAAGLAAEPIAEASRGEVWATIIAVADEHDASVIVMGARGLSPVKSLLLGSVPTKVVHHARRPVLVVPGPE
jgi:nucleotide-binding universal stress UspA family protein